MDVKWERLSLGMTTTQILGSPRITLFLNSDHYAARVVSDKWLRLQPDDPVVAEYPSPDWQGMEAPRPFHRLRTVVAPQQGKRECLMSLRAGRARSRSRKVTVAPALEDLVGQEREKG